MAEMIDSIGPVAVTAATAAAAAGLAYLDAKFHITKDIATIRGKAWVAREWAKAVKRDRCSLYYFFEESAKLRPNQECIWSRVGCYTWAEALDRAHQYGQLFLSRGVKPGDFVALVMHNTPDFMLAWMGLFSIGAAAGMINHHLKDKALLHCINVSTAKLILVDGDEGILGRVNEVREQLESDGKELVFLDDVREQLYNSVPIRPRDELRKGVEASTPIALIYTSGTTGFPKACVLPTGYTFALALGNQWGNFPATGTQDRCYCCMPYYHGTGGISSISALLNGGTLCVGPKFSVSRFWSDIRDSKATWFVYVGETVRYLLTAPPSPRDKEHYVHSIYGNGLRPDVWDRFKDRFGIRTIYEMFNTTEGMLSLANPSNNDFSAHSVGHHGLLLRRQYNNEIIPVAIDAETGDIARNPDTGFAIRVPYEDGGEILMKIPGEKAFGGYFNNPVATEKKYIRGVLEKGDCYYRSGDCLRRDKDGRWYFMDRLGDTFRWKGENVSTAEVSEVLGKYPGVLEANVYGVQLPAHDGKAGAAAITVDPAAKKSFDHTDFLRHARTHLPKYAVPVFIRHVANHTTMHNNKQNKVPLKNEGVHPDKVEGGDKVFWINEQGKGHTYIPFTKEDWEDLHAEKAKL